MKLDDVKELQTMFHMRIVPEQITRYNETVSAIAFNISMRVHPFGGLFSGVHEMPREINRIIMSFLTFPINIKLILHPSRNYPFTPAYWELSHCNVKALTHPLKSTINAENRQFCDWSLIWVPQKMCLLMLMRMKLYLQMWLCDQKLFYFPLRKNESLRRRLQKNSGCKIYRVGGVTKFLLRWDPPSAES